MFGLNLYHANMQASETIFSLVGPFILEDDFQFDFDTPSHGVGTRGRETRLGCESISSNRGSPAAAISSAVPNYTMT
jgi:hypothetical protein